MTSLHTQGMIPDSSDHGATYIDNISLASIVCGNCLTRAIKHTDIDARSANNISLHKAHIEPVHCAHKDIFNSTVLSLYSISNVI